MDLEAAVGKRFDESISDTTLFTQFLAALKTHLGAEDLDWRSQVELLSDSGKRVLMCACTALPNDLGKAPGVVLVFDDITTLLQARSATRPGAKWRAAWRTKSKTPSPPIQLSAERMRRKFLGQHECGGCPDPGTGNAHHRRPGRCDEADGQAPSANMRARPTCISRASI